MCKLLGVVMKFILDNSQGVTQLVMTEQRELQLHEVQFSIPSVKEIIGAIAQVLWHDSCI